MYVHKSGAQKRKENKRKEELEAKLPKINKFFKASNTKSETIVEEDDNSESESHSVFDSESEITKTESGSGLGSEFDAKPETESASESEAADTLTVTVSSVINSQAETDIGVWIDSDMNEDRRTFWIAKGSKECQHIDNGFEKSATVFGKEKFKRSCSLSLFFRIHSLTGEKIPRTWLCYSPSKGCVFCFACKLFPSSITQFNTGFYDWKHADERISSHEDSPEHRAAMVALCTRHRSTGQVDADLVRQYNSECQYWRNVLQRLCHVIQFLCERGLPLRGANEQLNTSSNGNYLGLLELLAKYDSFMEEHISKYGQAGRGHASYLSSTICDELIVLMGEKVLEMIIREVKTAKYFSISVDSTPDVTHVDQLTMILRYVLPDGPVERFLQFIPIDNHSGAQIAEVMLDFLSKHSIQITDCRGQSYDNAANMSGKYIGVQQCIRQECKYAEYVPCAAHSLNLVGNSAAASCTAAVGFFDIVQKVYVFFSASTFRWGKLSSLLQPLGLQVVKRLSDTRWSARHDAIRALCKGYLPICETLNLLCDDQDQTAECRAESNGSLRKL
jgi:hypothetical protein